MAAVRSAGVPVSLVNIRTRDGVALNGVLVEPRGRRRAAFIWVHGLGSTFAGGQPLIGALSRRLTAAGIAYLKCDTRGHHVVARAGRRLGGVGSGDEDLDRPAAVLVEAFARNATAARSFTGIVIPRARHGFAGREEALARALVRWVARPPARPRAARRRAGGRAAASAG